MARRVFDRFTKVVWVPDIVDMASPTEAECALGTDLTTYIPKDGVRPSTSQNTVDQGDISTQFEPKTIGTYSEDFELTMYRGTPGDDDDAWDLIAINTAGFLVIRRMVDSSADLLADDVVEVRAVQMGWPQMANSTANENQKFSVKFAVTEAPALESVVVA